MISRCASVLGFVVQKTFLSFTYITFKNFHIETNRKHRWPGETASVCFEWCFKNSGVGLDPGSDPEVRHNNTEESILYYIRELHNNFTLLQWISLLQSHKTYWHKLILLCFECVTMVSICYNLQKKSRIFITQRPHIKYAKIRFNLALFIFRPQLLRCFSEKWNIRQLSWIERTASEICSKKLTWMCCFWHLWSWPYHKPTTSLQR